MIMIEIYQVQLHTYFGKILRHSTIKVNRRQDLSPSSTAIEIVVHACGVFLIERHLSNQKRFPQSLSVVSIDN